MKISHHSLILMAKAEDLLFTKFDKNEKLSFISADMLILGCDIGSETHYNNFYV